MKQTEREHPIKVGKPPWLRRKLPVGPQYEEMRKQLRHGCLTTVCQEAQCPNQFECYSRGTATFMILGDKCSRNCTFCAVSHGPDRPPDPDEPARVGAAVKALQLQYSVVTSVTRDDLDDGGASHFVATINEIRRRSPGTLVEILIPDLQGNRDALREIIGAKPDVLNHNIETVPRLYPTVRPEALYRRSIDLLAEVKKIDPDMVSKSGIMLGLGESRAELLAVMDDLLQARCDILTMGQYLQPSKHHLAIVDFITPQVFDELGAIALQRGFAGVASGPSVRSSYEAEVLYNRAIAGLSA